MSTPQTEFRRERRLPVRTIGAVSASVLAFPLLASTAEAATFPYPKPSRTLPAALDVAAFYQEGTRCLTENQPGAVAFAKLLNATYGTHVYGILRKCAAEVRSFCIKDHRNFPQDEDCGPGFGEIDHYKLLQPVALRVHLHAGLGRCRARSRIALAAFDLDQA